MARALIELWNEGVRTIPTEYLDPAVELDSPFSSVSGVPYRGHVSLPAMMASMSRALKASK